MLLIAIDFDHTIVNGQTHMKIMLSQETDKDRQWDQIKDFPVIGEPGEWKRILENLIKENHSVCIVSFNSYAHIIPRYLQEKVGLSHEDIEKIKVISWLPPHPETANKNQHLRQAKKIMNFHGKNSQIILIDDSRNNLDAARKKKYTIIPADENGFYLSYIEQEVQLLSAKEYEASLKSKCFFCPPVFFKMKAPLLKTSMATDVLSVSYTNNPALAVTFHLS